MRNILRFLVVLAVTIYPATVFNQMSSGSTSLAAADQSSTPDVLFSIPVGDDGIHYTRIETGESEVWGPSSFRVAPDGTFLITDTVESRILRFHSDGSKLDTIKVEDAVSISDVAAGGSSIFALDEAAPEPSVHHLSSEGLPQGKITLPEEIRSQGLSGIAVDEDGEVMTEFRGGASTTRLDGQVQTSKTAKKKLFSLEVPDLSDKSLDHSKGFVVKDGNRIMVKVDSILGGLTMIGTGLDGDFFVLVEELSNTHTLHVDQTVRHYSSDGTLLGAARVPLAERYTYVAHGVTVAPDGNVYALITKPDRADIIRLSFKRRLKPILPQSDDSGDMVTSGLMQAAACSRTRDEMINTAWSYRNNRVYLTTTNLNGTCSGRSKPRYLGTAAGYYDSVPYDWGGFDTVSDFNYYMSQNYKAGDIWTCDTCYESCSRGVDCSGFVSRCWGTSRYTTSSLPSISTEINISQAQKGDIANLAGSHVAMIESIVSNGVYTLEATEYNSYDRVVYIYNGWSRFNGYRYYRYNNVCDTTAQARPVVSSSLTLSGSSYYVGQTINGNFTITNRGSQSVTFSRLLIGGRLNGDQSCSGGCPDFSSAYNVTLSPGQSYYYSGSRYLDRSGTYSFFVAYQKTDGSWVTSVETENSAVNTRSITVQSQQAGPPSLSSHSPYSLYASPYSQTVYFYGQRLANTTAMYVYFPNGSGTYIYPPSQITGRWDSSLRIYLPLSGRGWYTFYAYTSNGGWSNSYWVYVN